MMPEYPAQNYVAGFVIMDMESNEKIYNSDGALFKSEEEAISYLQPLMIKSDNPFKYILVPANDHIPLN